MIRSVVGGLALLALASASSDGQALITGTVKDSAGRALAGAQVILEGAGREARTDSAGKYRISADPETYTVVFRQIGYGPLTRRARLTRGGNTVVDAVLAQGDVPQLDTVEVRALRPRGIGREAFEERRAMGLGKFIDSTQLRKMESRRLVDVLRDQGVRMVQTKGATAKAYAANPVKVTMEGGASCFMSVILDGVTIYRARNIVPGRPGDEEPPPDLSRDFNILNMEAIEVYRGAAQVPLEFSGYNVDCGVIVLWTRRGK